MSVTTHEQHVVHESHPSRVRGLKLDYLFRRCSVLGVAPFTGAWIEIYGPILRASFISLVAPFTGAWIEIWK